jgi:hypothetical protein
MLFTIALNKRITSFCENFCENNKAISDAQFEFKKGKSTADALFILLNSVQHHFYENKRLYCVVVDFEKCIDTLYRNALLVKMYKLVVQGKLLRIISDM